MHNQQGFVGLPVLLAILIGIVVLGGGAYYVVQQQPPSQTASESFDNLQQFPIQAKQSPSKDNQPPTSIAVTSAVEVLSLSYPSLTYRINYIEHKDARLRIIDIPSGFAMWDETEIAIGIKKIDLANLVKYEDVKISLPAGTYRLRLEVFIGGTGKTLAESDTFTIPGAVVAVPTCTLRADRQENPTTLTWASTNADEAYVAHLPAMGGSPIIYGLNSGKKVSMNGSETVTWNGALEESWIVEKNTRGATVCYPNGTTYFNSQKEIDNPPTMM